MTLYDIYIFIGSFRDLVMKLTARKRMSISKRILVENKWWQIPSWEKISTSLNLFNAFQGLNADLEPILYDNNVSGN